MTKQELKSLLASKKGFVREISDQLTPDTIAGDTIEKRVVRIEHINADGSAGISNVFYLYDTVNDLAKFYNSIPEVFDVNELTTDQKKQKALEDYLKAKYLVYFINRTDLVNNWAEATVYTLTSGKLAKKTIIVFKQGSNPINDVDVV